MLTDQNHGYADPDIPIGRQMPLNAPVQIGSGSWLGAGAVILPGASIGRNVVIAAGSVVRGTVPDHCVVAGVPAKIVRQYHPPDGWTPARRSDLPLLPTPTNTNPSTSTNPLVGTNHPAGVDHPNGVTQSADPAS